jgi:hypothetical protein
MLLLAVGSLLASANHLQRPGVWLGFGTINLVWAVLLAALARQYARRGLLISATGIVVRNLFSTHTIALTDAAGFVPGVAGGLGGPCLILKRHSSESVSVGAMARVAVVWRYGEHLRELQPLCVELEALVSEIAERNAIQPGTALSS